MAEIHRRSAAQEKALAGAVKGGQVSARSGAGWLRKADVRSERFLYEAKSTNNKKSYTIKEDDLAKIRQHGFIQQRPGVLVFDLNGRSYCVVAQELWIEETGGG